MGFVLHLFPVVYVHLTVLANCAGKGLHSIIPRFISHGDEAFPFTQSSERSARQQSYLAKGSEYRHADDSESQYVADQADQEVPRTENYERYTLPAQSFAGPETVKSHTRLFENVAASAQDIAIRAPVRPAGPEISDPAFPGEMGAQTFKKLLLLLMLGSHRFSKLAADDDYKSVAEIIRDHDAGELENLELLLWEAYQQADEPEEVASFIRHLNSHTQNNSQK